MRNFYRSVLIMSAIITCANLVGCGKSTEESSSFELPVSLQNKGCKLYRMESKLGNVLYVMDCTDPTLQTKVVSTTGKGATALITVSPVQESQNLDSVPTEVQYKGHTYKIAE